jgi:hypothetical protein
VRVTLSPTGNANAELTIVEHSAMALGPFKRKTELPPVKTDEGTSDVTSVAPPAGVAWRAGSARGELSVAADFSSYALTVDGVPWPYRAANSMGPGGPARPLGTLPRTLGPSPDRESAAIGTAPAVVPRPLAGL